SKEAHQVTNTCHTRSGRKIPLINVSKVANRLTGEVPDPYPDPLTGRENIVR
ncbi:hypothetical protein WUBG_18899, partial [Wuchereria bancrofti]